MLNLNEFVQEMKTRLEAKFPEATIKESLVKKANGIELISLSVHRDGQMVAPNLYVNDGYERYTQGVDLSDIADRFVESINTAIDGIQEIPSADEFLCKEKVYGEVMNRDSNEEYLSDKPHRDLIGDITLIYRLLVSKDNQGVASVAITNDLAETLGVTEEELFDLAVTQTKELFPPMIQNLADMFAQMGVPIPGDEAPLLILTNTDCQKGAHVLLYPELFKDLSEGDLIIMPSSVHEVLALPVEDGVTPEDAASMVNDINGGVVDVRDRLSNSVFIYRKETGEIEVAIEGKAGIGNDVYRAA